MGSVNDFIVEGNRIYLVDQKYRVMALTIDGGVTLWTKRSVASPADFSGAVE